MVRALIVIALARAGARRVRRSHASRPSRRCGESRAGRHSDRLAVRDNASTARRGCDWRTPAVEPRDGPRRITLVRRNRRPSTMSDAGAQFRRAVARAPGAAAARPRESRAAPAGLRCARADRSAAACSPATFSTGQGLGGGADAVAGDALNLASETVDAQIGASSTQRLR